MARRGQLRGERGRKTGGPAPSSRGVRAEQGSAAARAEGGWRRRASARPGEAAAVASLREGEAAAVASLREGEAAACRREGTAV